MGLPVRETARHTYGEYLTWPEDQRYELVDGIAYAMTPASGRRHQKLVVELLRQVANALEGSVCDVYVAPFDVRLPRADEVDAAVDTVLQPDLAVICDPAKLDERGCRGAPDWVVEVLSPATAVHDQTRKREIYERHGVPELWLVHPTDSLVMIYRLREGAFGKPEVRELAGELAPEGLPGVRLELDRLVGG